MKRFQYVFLDSGIGGIPYLKELLKLSPQSSCLYVADTKNFPYGNKTQEEVLQFSKELVDDIIKKVSPSIIIIACNTITMVALKSLRNSFSIPFVGTVPAIKVAANVTKNNNIALIGTLRTVNDVNINKMLKEFAPNAKFISHAESDLVNKIEDGLIFENEEKRLKTILPIMESLNKDNIDTLILGCTHFLHLREDFITLGKQFSPEIRVVDSLEGVIKQTLKLSPQENIEKKHVFYVTGVNKNKETEEKYYNYSKYFSLDFIKKI